MDGSSYRLADIECAPERLDLCGEEPGWWERGASGLDCSR